MYEEMEECAEQLKNIEKIMISIWYAAKNNIEANDFVELMKSNAINLACEAIQVAAMCDKWKMSFDAGCGSKHSNKAQEDYDDLTPNDRKLLYKIMNGLED